VSGAFLYQWVLATAAGERVLAVGALSDECLCRLAVFLDVLCLTVIVNRHPIRRTANKTLLASFSFC
jgi:hypothetical protein